MDPTINRAVLYRASGQPTELVNALRRIAKLQQPRKGTSDHDLVLRLYRAGLVSTDRWSMSQFRLTHLGLEVFTAADKGYGPLCGYLVARELGD